MEKKILHQAIIICDFALFKAKQGNIYDSGCGLSERLLAQVIRKEAVESENRRRGLTSETKRSITTTIKFEDKGVRTQWWCPGPFCVVRKAARPKESSEEGIHV